MPDTPPGGGSWSDYWNGLSQNQDYYNGGGGGNSYSPAAAYSPNRTMTGMPGGGPPQPGSTVDPSNSNPYSTPPMTGGNPYLPPGGHPPSPGSTVGNGSIPSIGVPGAGGTPVQNPPGGSRTYDYTATNNPPAPPLTNAWATGNALWQQQQTQAQQAQANAANPLNTQWQNLQGTPPTVTYGGVTFANPAYLNNLSTYAQTPGAQTYNSANPSTNSSNGSGNNTSSTNLPGTNFPATNPFGANPFMNNPTATNPPGAQTGTTQYNPNYFPTQSTADIVAKLLGGTVGTGSMLKQGGGGFTQNQPNYFVTLPNGNVINPGFIAQYYQQYANDPQMLARMINSEVTGGEAYPGNQTPGQSASFAPFSYNQSSTPGFANNPTAADLQVQAGMSGNQGFQGGQNFGKQQSNYNTNPVPAAQQSSASVPQAQQTQQNPFDFGAAVARLFGSNPYAAAFGSNGTASNMLGSILAQSLAGNSMGNISSILNALYALRQSPTSGLMSPLFWGGQANPQSNYYPSFY